MREALARLSAERMVRLAPHHGYAVALPSARRLEHLYELSGSLIHLALERASRLKRTRVEHQLDLPLSGAYAADLAALLAEIAASQPNCVLCETIAALNDQLHCVRRCEPNLFAGADQELTALVTLWKNGNFGDLRLRLRDHHRSRRLRVDALARLLSEESGLA